MIDRIIEDKVRTTLLGCDVRIDGLRPWDIRVRDRSFYRRVALNPAFEIGETYLDGLWDCDAIDELFFRLMSSDAGKRAEHGFSFQLRDLVARLRNPQSRSRARQVADLHYDVDTELYRRMLDETMSYTCAYFREPGESLGRAQANKLAMICGKLDLRRGDRLLDIGCGFGGLARFAAREYGAHVVGVTNSREHHAFASARRGKLPVEFICMDYRDLPALGRSFDKISSIEMIEAVGPRNYREYLTIVRRCLEPGGRFLLQTFISDRSQHVCNEWFDRHIFPNGVSPSFAQLSRATEGIFGAPRDVHDFGPHYAPTLLAWDRNLRNGWEELPRKYDRRFRRMWHFYLTSLAGVFRAGGLHLCHIVYGDAASDVRRHPRPMTRNLVAA